MDTPSPALEISNLAFTYADLRREGKGLLEVPSLTLAPAEQMLLTGSSGSGKSTLLQLIAGLFGPDRGSVRIAGQDVHALGGAARDHFRGRRIGMIFQTFNLLHGFSALENVMAALMFSDIPPREHRKRAADLLASLGIERTGAMPERLSVGQQQRVAVARAVACDPVLVLADEPTASLDPANAAGAMDLIQQACKQRGAALLVTSHDPAMTSRFTRVVSLDKLAPAAT